MLNNSENALFSTLKKMVKHCQEMRQLLEDDKQYFTQRQLKLIQESNKKKADVITQLSVLANELNAQHPEGFAKKVEQQDVLQVMDELKSEVTKCYKHIMVNSSIVFINLQQVKQIWDTLLASKPSQVYDRSGTAVR